MSLIKRSYKYRMYPNKTQEELLAKTFGCVRVVWNACVDSFNSYDKETNPNPKFPTKSDLVIEKPWLNEVSAATLQQKQRDFIEFSRQYFNKNRKEKLGKPNYKNKHDNQSFRLPFPSLKSLTIRSGSKRSDGLRLLSIVEFQTTLVLSPVPFQRTVLVNISYQFL